MSLIYLICIVSFISSVVNFKNNIYSYTKIINCSYDVTILRRSVHPFQSSMATEKCIITYHTRPFLIVFR